MHSVNSLPFESCPQEGCKNISQLSLSKADSTKTLYEESGVISSLDISVESWWHTRSEGARGGWSQISSPTSKWGRILRHSQVFFHRDQKLVSIHSPLSAQCLHKNGVPDSFSVLMQVNNEPRGQNSWKRGNSPEKRIFLGAEKTLLNGVACLEKVLQKFSATFPVDLQRTLIQVPRGRALYNMKEFNSIELQCHCRRHQDRQNCKWLLMYFLCWSWLLWWWWWKWWRLCSWTSIEQRWWHWWCWG